MRTGNYGLTAIGALWLAAACTSDPNIAPVELGATSAPPERIAEGDAQFVSARAWRADYTVKRGDTLYGVARRFGLHVRELAAANDIDAPYTIKPGDVLVIPRTAETTAETEEVVAAAPEPAPKPVAAAEPERRREGGGWFSRMGRQGRYEVKKGDTLYSIAREHGVDVRRLARANDIHAPYLLKVGDRLDIPKAAAPATRSRRMASARPAAAPLSVETAAVRPAEARRPPAPTTGTRKPAGNGRFIWPVTGEIISSYGRKADGRQNEGVNIAAADGTPIRAAADGVVAYAGDEIKGYGNLLLIRHKGDWVTAYAHVKRILVRENQHVTQGQVVAEVGASGPVIRPQLHFEIRKDLKAHDPMAFLAAE